MRTVKIYLGLIGLLLVMARMVLAQASFPYPKISYQPRQYVCYRATGSLSIDGKLNEKDWQSAPWTETFVDIEGSLKPKPRFETRVKMLWDDTYFYVAAYLQEPDVWARLKQRDTIIYHDNDFEIFIDPDGDTHEYYEFEINALGTYWDLFLTRPYRDRGCALTGWDAKGFRSAVSVDGTLNNPADTDRGWQVEIAIPWRALKKCAHCSAPPHDGDQWRVNFSRVEWKVDKSAGYYRKQINPQTGKPFPEENWVWSPQGLVAMHYPEMWGLVQFSGKGVGTSHVPFAWRTDEEAKWLLFLVYYAERSYFKRYGRFTGNINELSIKPQIVPGYRWPPRIEATDDCFEAVLFPETRGKSWRIRQDGKVWQY